MKLCRACGKDLPVDEFNLSRANSDGLQSRCRPCQKSYFDAWYLKNASKKDRNQKARRAKNPDYDRQWYAKRYQDPVGRAVILAGRMRYRARRAGASGSYTASEWLELCDKYGNVCLSCLEYKSLTVDHVIPLSKGGTNDISNIQPLCGPCNSKKKDSNTDYRSQFDL